MKFLPLTRRREEENHYNISEGGWKALRKLVLTEEWKLYKSIAHRHLELMGERLLTADPSMVMEVRGEIKGFREALTLVDDLLGMKGQADGRRKSERTERDSRARRVEQSGAFSPFYGAGLTK